VPFWSGHPGASLQVEFPDEISIFADVAVQGRMIGLVHRDFEPANGPFNDLAVTPPMLSRDNSNGKPKRVVEIPA
jgi:hypothetical protein